MRIPIRFLLTAAPLLVALHTVSPFSFEPIVSDFASSGRDAVQTYKLVNNGAESIAVRISMLTRDMDIDGREEYQPADALFTVYPSRVVLPAAGVQMVKVQWKGPAALSVERCFRILVEQLPVDFGTEQKAGGSIRVLFRYLGAVYILPPEPKPDVILSSARAAVDAAGRRGIEIVFENRGNAHVILGDLSITLSEKGSDGAAKRVFGPDELTGIAGENILPGLKRRFFLTFPDGLQVENPDVAFAFEPLR